MSTYTDTQGFRVKDAHTGQHGIPIGQYIYVIERIDGTVYGAWPDRHEAVGAITKFRDTHQLDWFDVKPVPVGAYRFGDWIQFNSVFDAGDSGE